MLSISPKGCWTCFLNKVIDHPNLHIAHFDVSKEQEKHQYEFEAMGKGEIASHLIMCHNVMYCVIFHSELVRGSARMFARIIGSEKINSNTLSESSEGYNQMVLVHFSKFMTEITLNYSHQI